MRLLVFKNFNKDKANEFLDSLGIDTTFIEQRNLIFFDDAQELVVADVSQSGREHQLILDAANAWSTMKTQAYAEGISLIIVSAFRSFDRQVEIVEHSIQQGQDIKTIFKLSAPPGYSEHHSGRAIDIGTMGCEPLSQAFGDTDAFNWLKANAQNFGFRLSYPENNQYGFKYEPWHWFYEGSVSIRKVDNDDVQSLQSLGIKTFSETFDDTNSPKDMDNYLSEKFSLDKLVAELSNPESEFYFAELAGKAIGYLKLNTGKAQTEQSLENALEIERIYVLNAFHGKRVGKLLFDKALDIARSNGSARIWLGVWENNLKAIEFYQRQGFEKFAEHTFVLGEKRDIDWLM